MFFGLLVPASAQDYPTKPVRIIVPFPPGGINDIVARIIAQHLGERLGKQFIVDNRGGAGGVVGGELVANAPKDGHTLLIVSIAIAVNPWLYTLPYDTIKAFAPVAMLATAPNVVAVNPGLPVHSIKEFVALAKKQAGRTAICLVRRRHVPASGRRAVQAHGRRRHPAHPVPRRGPGDDRRDRRPHRSSFASMTSIIRHIRSGKLRALGVGARSAARAAGRADRGRSRRARLRGRQLDRHRGDRPARPSRSSRGCTRRFRRSRIRPRCGSSSRPRAPTWCR